MLRCLANALAALLLLAGTARAQALMDWPDLFSRPLPHATERIAYGADPNQFAELWLPDGRGPFPVTVMLHGGCWKARIATHTIMNYAAEDLRAHGIAVWNVEYRGVDQPGGGYPGTFLDVAQGADALRVAARTHALRLDHVVAFGHSAGGHLGLWLAARSRLPRSSALYVRRPLRLDAVISSGGLPDLEADRAADGEAACGARVIDQLVGAPSAEHPNVYADTSPAALLPFPARQFLVNSDQDPVAPPWLGEAYLHKAQAAGAHAEMIVIPHSGHAELIAPGAEAWTRERALIQSLLH